jgi:outer membrane protein TolC
VASDQAEAGTANRSVFLESEASMLSASADLLRAEYDRSVAAADLTRLVGHEVTASVGDKQVVNAPRDSE